MLQKMVWSMQLLVLPQCRCSINLQTVYFDSILRTDLLNLELMDFSDTRYTYLYVYLGKKGQRF